MGSAFSLPLVLMGADDSLINDWEFCQVGQALELVDIETLFLKPLTIVGRSPGDLLDQRLELLDLQRLDTFGGPPLALIKVAPHLNGIVALEAFVQGK